MNKYAIFTMDVEDFSDIYCLRKRKKQTFPSMKEVPIFARGQGDSTFKDLPFEFLFEFEEE